MKYLAIIFSWGLSSPISVVLCLRIIGEMGLLRLQRVFQLIILVLSTPPRHLFEWFPA